MQAKSDLVAAKDVQNENDASTYCQALAKYQQCTEKSIKGMIAALNELGVSQPSISGNHALQHEINGLDALRRSKSNLDSASVGVVDRVVKGYKADIIQLCSLAPSGPKYQVYYKNTEYPFNDASAEGWTASAVPGTYTWEEVKKAHQITWPLHQIAAKFASSLRRRK